MHVAWAWEEEIEKRSARATRGEKERREERKVDSLNGLSRLDKSSVLKRGESILEQVSFGLRRNKKQERKVSRAREKRRKTKERRTNLESSETVAQLLSQLHVHLSSSSNDVLSNLDSSETSSELLLLRLGSSGDDLRAKR